MEKLTIVSSFAKTIEILRNTECGKKEKIHHFHQISEYLTSPSMIGHINYGKHCSSAIGVLLFFCEDLDSVVRMSAEENLNKIIRSLERNRMSRIFLDLYYEIKKNGNEKSLRISLNLFSHYCPRIKEKNVKWYALKLLPCLQAIALRKETLLNETLCDFMKNFGKYLQICLNDNETFKLMEVFLSNIISNCAVKRRCSALNCLTLIENSRNKISMSRYGLNKAFEFLIADQETNTVVGVLGFLRLLLPFVISQNICDCKQILEIYDVCLHLLNNSNHSIINASLEVINSILNQPNRTLETLLTNQKLQHKDILKKRKSLKNQIFQFKNSGITCTASDKHFLNRHTRVCEKEIQNIEKKNTQKAIEDDAIALNKHKPLRKSTEKTITNVYKSGKNTNKDENSKENISNESEFCIEMQNETNELENSDKSNKIFINDDSECCLPITNIEVDDVNINDDDELQFDEEEEKPLKDIVDVTLEVNEPHKDDNNLLMDRIEDKSQVLSDIDNESFNSIDFESEITIGERDEKITNKDDSKSADTKSLKSTDSIGSFFNSFLSVSNTETMTKLFRPSAKLSTTTTDLLSSSMAATTTNTPETKRHRFPNDKNTLNQASSSSLLSHELTSLKSPITPPSPFLQLKATPSKVRTVEMSDLMYHSLPTMTDTTTSADMLTFQDKEDTFSLESINSHISLGSHVSFQSSTQDPLRNEQDLVLVQANDYKNVGTHSEFSQGQIKDDEAYGGDGSESDEEKTYALVEQSKASSTVISLDPFTVENDKVNETLLVGNSLCEGENKKSCNDIDDGNNKNDEFIKMKTVTDIGTIYDQTIIQYTARFISYKFLLSGMPQILIPDTNVRVSIKSLSLSVVANCVKLEPSVLCLTMEIDKTQSMMHSKSYSVEQSVDSNDNSSNEVENDFQMTEQIKKNNPEVLIVNNQSENDDLLEIKDDHFGECTTTSFLLNSPLNKRTDDNLVLELQNKKFHQITDCDVFSTEKVTNNNSKLSHQLEQILSKSEIIESKTKSQQITETSSNLIRTNRVNPFTVNRETQIKKSKKQTENEKLNSGVQQQQPQQYDKRKQYIHDILLFYNHSDPILRGNVQIVVGNFIYGLLLSGNNIEWLSGGPWNLNKILAILIKGFRDDIHTVVIQALTSFDKIFPLLMFNHRKLLSKQMDLNEAVIDTTIVNATVANDDDDDDDDDAKETYIENMIFRVGIKCSDNKNENENKDEDCLDKSVESSFLKKSITPKLLLDQLCLCYENKYWVVQNKFAEIISNLDCEHIRECYGDDVACFYEETFLSQLLKLLEDDDVRVREYTAKRLCHYIQFTSCVSSNKNMERIEEKMHQANLNLFKEFFDYRVFLGMSASLRTLLNDERHVTATKEKLLSRVLYLMTNKLIELNDKNLQSGIIFTLKTLLNQFNPIDYMEVWNEYNFDEICLTFACQNYGIAMDSQCQSDLMEIITKLLAANTLTLGKVDNRLLDGLIVHTLKLLNIYQYLFSNQKPSLFIKVQKPDIFGSTKELTVSSAFGYFGNNYFYIKLYNTLKSAYDAYKITINQDSGSKLLCLLSTSLHTLSACLDMKEHSNSALPLLKLVEEILQYLTILINYEPVETIFCLRQLLKYLFARNYANRKEDYQPFITSYFTARRIIEIRNEGANIVEDEINKIFNELLVAATNFPLGKRKGEEESAKHIKLFEPSVIYCLTLFMKSNATVQVPILELLYQLLEFNVTYSILDSKSVIFEQVMKNLELIETGVARNATIVICAIVRFLVALTKQNDKKLITIPKIISVINGLLANNGIKVCSVLALKALSFEIFFIQKTTISSSNQTFGGSNTSLNIKELSTQKEVIHGMLEKFITCLECQKTLAVLLFWNKMWPEEPSFIQDRTMISVLVKTMECGQTKVNNFENFFVLDSLFRNSDRNVLLDSEAFISMISLFVAKNVDNYSDLSQFIIILHNVLLKTDDVYLSKHVKLFLENSQSESHCEGEELNFFAKVLHEKLKTCLTTLIKYPEDNDYSYLVTNYIKILLQFCVCSKNAINSTFTVLLKEDYFCGKYHLTGTPNLEYLQMEVLKLVCDLNSDKILSLYALRQVENMKIRRILLQRLCNKFNDPSTWTVEDVNILFSKEFIEIIIDGNCPLISFLCGVPTNANVILRNLSSNLNIFQKRSLPSLITFIKGMNAPLSHKIQLLSELYDKVESSRTLQSLIERSLQEAIALLEKHSNDQNRCESTSISYGIKNIQLRKPLSGIQRQSEEIEDTSGTLKSFEKQNIDEKWLIEQIIKFSSTRNYEEYVRILLHIKSEFKLRTIFSSIGCNVRNILETCIRISTEYMLLSFQNDCVIHNPHINYMNLNALLKVSLNFFTNELRYIASTPFECNNEQNENINENLLSMSSIITAFLRNVEHIEMISLIYIEYKFVQKFITEQIFKQEELIQLFIDFSLLCAKRTRILLNSKEYHDRFSKIYTFYECIDAILRQKLIWVELNKSEKYVTHLNTILDMLYDGITKSIKNTLFCKRYETQVKGIFDLKEGITKGRQLREDMEHIEKAIFVAKLIEIKTEASKDNVEEAHQEEITMKFLNSIAVSLLRSHRYYAFAITPLEVFVCYGNGSEFLNKSSNLLSIPVERLSDADVLQKFVKRLFIFGFSTRQQFEECFMTLLLLINKVYDENMVDEQEQFQIKSICLTAILELLISCKSFPVVGNRLSRFYHNARYPKIKCTSISLKKLHKVQLIIPGSNVFYQPNLERKLSPSYDGNGWAWVGGVHQHYSENNVIGTNLFLPNQYGLNHVWQLMEGTLNESEVKEDTPTKNFRYFIEASGIDLKSSSQLIFDVLTQLIENNYILVLPNLVKFCEICENRDQIKWIKDKLMKIHESIPIDDTISHQYIIYLLCKTQSILIPSSADLAHLCSVISTYLKSTHVFIRNATLHGLLCLLECCSKTSTSIGKLSEELCMVRDLIIGYITRHGIIEESSIQFSDTHTKLVWALNFSLIEVTSKFVPDCNLLSNSIISANNLLKRTTNEDIYLCILHGLERIIVINSATNTTQPICDKIEKLAVELVKIENERFSMPALKLLLSCIYIGSSKQLENTEHSNGIVQDDPEIIVQQTEKVDILLHRIKSSTTSAAQVYGQVLCQIIRDLVPPNEILTKVIKEFLAINQPHCEVIARIVYQVFRSAIDSSFLQMLQDWLICSLPTFITLPEEKGVWCLTVIFLSASINLHLIKLFPIVLNEFRQLGVDEVPLFVISSQDFYDKLNVEQKERFIEAFNESSLEIYKIMLNSL